MRRCAGVRLTFAGFSRQPKTRRFSFLFPSLLLPFDQYFPCVQIATVCLFAFGSCLFVSSLQFWRWHRNLATLLFRSSHFDHYRDAKPAKDGSEPTPLPSPNAKKKSNHVHLHLLKAHKIDSNNANAKRFPIYRHSSLQSLASFDCV